MYMLNKPLPLVYIPPWAARTVGWIHMYVSGWVDGVGWDVRDDGSFKAFGAGDLDKCCHELGRNKQQSSSQGKWRKDVGF